MPEFSNLLGYDVKDAKAREMIDSILVENDITIFIGDSYAVTTDTIVSWQPLLADLLRLNTENVVYYAENGAGYHQKGNAGAGHAYIDFLSEHDKTNADKVKAIIVGGGFNDYPYELTEIQEAMNNFCVYVAEYFPNATIYNAFIGWHKTDVTITNKLIEKACFEHTHSGTNFVPLYGVENVLKEVSLISDDNIHPNQPGEINIANAMFKAINGGYKKYSYPYAIVCSVPSAPITTNVYIQFAGDVERLIINVAGFMLSETLTLSNTSFTTIMTLDNPVRSANPYCSKVIYIKFGLDGDFVPCLVALYGNELRAKLVDRATLSATYIEFTDTVFEFNSLGL